MGELRRVENGVEGVSPHAHPGKLLQNFYTFDTMKSTETKTTSDPNKISEEIFISL